VAAPDKVAALIEDVDGVRGDGLGGRGYVGRVSSSAEEAGDERELKELHLRRGGLS